MAVILSLIQNYKDNLILPELKRARNDIMLNYLLPSTVLPSNLEDRFVQPLSLHIIPAALFL